MNQLKTCRQCGAQIDAGAKFCSYCGFKHAAAAQAQQVQNKESRPQPGGQRLQRPPAGQQQRQNIQPPPGGHPGYNSGVPQGGASQGNNQYNSYPGYQNGGQGNMPPAYPQQQSRKSPVGIIIVLLLVLIAGGAFAYKTFLAPGQNIPAGSGGNTSPVANLLDLVKGAVKYDLSKPETYLPEPNLKMTYYEMYPDGDEGTLDLITANIIPNAPVSDVGMFKDGFGDVYAAVSHYFKKADGIYYIFDEEPYNSYQILPGVIQQGASWVYSSEYGNMVYTIKQLGATCTLDCGTFEDCLVVEEDNQVFEMKDLAYYAPGMGVILRQSVPDGANIYQLTSYQTLSAAEAQSVLLQYSYNHEKINSQIGG